MFLKRIEMQGFKSFADKTVISFTDPITGIVGPNGCGKSNISDAVRWVLGEQSARSMRGEKMNDVIFAGSVDRRKVNMAEVTLVFDNSSHILNDGRDEIEVTRRLYRDSNEAEYLINRNAVRLRDIVDLFSIPGLVKTLFPSSLRVMSSLLRKQNLQKEEVSLKRRQELPNSGNGRWNPCPGCSGQKKTWIGARISSMNWKSRFPL